MKVLADNINAPQAEGAANAVVLPAAKVTFHMSGTFDGVQILYSPDDVLPYVPVMDTQADPAVVTMDIGTGHYKAVVTGTVASASVVVIQP